MLRGILPASQPEVRLVSPTQSAPSFFGLGWMQSLSLFRWDSARNPSRTRAPVPSIGFGLSPQLGQGHTQTLWCTKTDKIRNNCSSCRTHMAIVIVQKKSKWSPLYLDEFHQFRNELDLESLRNDKCNRINTEVAFNAQIVGYQCRCFFFNCEHKNVFETMDARLPVLAQFISAL